MVLSSQTARPVSRRTHMYRRSRRPASMSRLVGLGAAVAVVAGAGYLAWSTFAGSDTDSNDATTVASTDTTTEHAAASDHTAAAGLGPAPSGAAGEPDRPEREPSANDQPPRPQITMGGGIDLNERDAERSEPDVADDPTPADAESPPQPQPTPGNRAARNGDDDRGDRRDARDRQSGSEASGDRARSRLETGLNQKSGNRPVAARRTLTAALASRDLSPTDAQRARQALREINETLVFSPTVVDNDPFSRTYTVQSGDTLQRIVNRENLDVDWRLIQRINGIADPSRIRVGQRLKVITGPFHAVVDKDAFRMDLYLGEGSERVFVRSYDVGLGEYDSTPEGRFIIEKNSKLIDPAWTNPRTREYYEPGDPENPIGNRWLGMRGLDDVNRDLRGYGIHGTIEPNSVGEMRSMGCIRVLPGEVEVVYEVLTEETSHVHVIRNRNTEIRLP